MDFLALLVMWIPAFIAGVIFVVMRKRIKILSYIFLGLAIVLAISIFSLWITEKSGKQLSHRFEKIQFFQRNMPDIPKINSPAWEYWVLAQSNLVQALYTYGAKYPEQDSLAKVMVQRIANNMVKEENFPFKDYTKRWTNQALYLSHLNIILATNHVMNNDDQYASLNNKISNYLSTGIVSSAFKHVFTAGKSQGYFPAENAVILEGLRLIDKVQNTNYLKRTHQDWKRFIQREIMHDNTKIVCSNFIESDKCKVLPQSPYLCWLSNYLVKVDPGFTKDVWHQTKFFFKENPLLIWADFTRHHPSELPPAYGKNDPRPLEIISPNVCSKLTAALTQSRLSYFQLNNYFLLKKLFNGATPITTENYWAEALNTVLHFRAECQ